jgi:hypothetical protein
MRVGLSLPHAWTRTDEAWPILLLGAGVPTQSNHKATKLKKEQQKKTGGGGGGGGVGTSKLEQKGSKKEGLQHLPFACRHRPRYL